VEATGNPSLLALALWAYGVAFREADPVGALNALGRGLVIAQDSGNRTGASMLAPFLARLEAEHGDTVSAFDHLTLAIRIYHNSGNTARTRSAERTAPLPTPYGRAFNGVTGRRDARGADAVSIQHRC
jgi:hypothetical protein